MAKRLLACLSAVVTAGCIAVATAQAVSAAAPQCMGMTATLVGTPATETLRGTDGDDVIVGGGSDGGADGESGDTVRGLGGDDTICLAIDATLTRAYGGPGDDRIQGSGLMWGGRGNDELTDPDPSDPLIPALFGGQGHDVLLSRATDINFFVPGAGNDTVTATDLEAGNLVWFRAAERGVLVDLRYGTARGQGTDVLTGINAVIGSPHSDIMVAAKQGDIMGARGADVLIGSRGGNHLVGGRGADVLAGHRGDDHLEGGRGDDRVDGGRGSDHLSGGAGWDLLTGRSGNDELLEQHPEPNLLLGGQGTDNCTGGYRVPPNVERSCETHRASGRSHLPLTKRVEAMAMARTAIQQRRGG